MGFKNKVLFILMTSLLAGLLNFSPVAFAEGDTVCKGRITGVTKTYNPSSGVISFDAHSGPGAQDNAAISLTITGNNPGLAPANRSDAACVNKEPAGTAYSTGYEYALKGWAWNNNGGFVSFNCKNGKNNAGGADIACGAFDYGVYVSADKGGGVRDVFGYAWNPTFGWIKFKSDPADAIPYGVKIDANGKASGYAWTQAQIYIDMSGITVNLPDKAAAADTSKWCDDKKALCVEVNPETGTKIADGVDGYNLDLYFRDENGDPVDASKIVNKNEIIFDWSDTVKLDQVKPDAVAGGATNYPKTGGDFKDAGDVSGHYITKELVTSFAPTSESKLSITTSTKPAYYVNNETFLSKPDSLQLQKQPNQLILNYVSYPDLKNVNGDVLIKAFPGSPALIYPNGKANLPFKFRPAIYVDTLYANDQQDNILAYRSVPFIVKRKLSKIGSLPEGTDGTVDFRITYSASKAVLDQADCANATFNFMVEDVLTGKTLNVSSDVEIKNAISSLLTAAFDFNITADLPTGPEANLACKVASGANIYSVISYSTSAGQISYYDNKLPRIGADTVQNPAVVVHGNIYGMTGNVRGDQRVQTTGSVNVNMIRDVIYENLQKYVDQAEIKNLAASTCTLAGFKDQSYGFTATSGCPKVWSYFDVGNEHVLYARGSDITLKLPTDADGFADWGGKWVIVADGGNIFIDGNLYAKDPSKSKISLVAMRSSKDEDYLRTGNVYLAPCSKNVTNTQGTFIGDGSFFSYDGDHSHIDNAVKGTGEPKWSDYSTMIKALGCQYVHQGSMSFDNTVGGANLDQGTDPKPYLLRGGGKVIPLPATIQNRMKAQYYDLNYLRMFRLDLKLSAGGLPIDQSCGKAWEPQDQVDYNAILNALKQPPDADGNLGPLAETSICGEKKNSDGSLCAPNLGMSANDAACNGINPLVKYDDQNPDGDLVVPTGGMILAKGLGSDDYDPVYVYYVAPDKDSFVFQKAGAKNTSGG